MPPQSFDWPTPPGLLNLPTDEIHVWRVRLDVEPAREAARRATLAPDELVRADRFAFPELRRRFVVARGTLRMLLGRYLHEPAEAIAFDYNEYGKPSDRRNRCQFNVSHTGEMMLCAITRSLEVGIDVEAISERVDVDGMSERVFTVRERGELASLPAAMRRRAFFLGWSRKEACLKALGAGLSFPLKQLDVSLSPSEPPLVIAAPGPLTLIHLDAGPGVASALAVEASAALPVRCWEWIC